jgi:transposase
MPKEKFPPAPRKAQISDEKIERVLQLYDEGISIRKIANMTSTGRVTIAKLVKERSGK